MNTKDICGNIAHSGVDGIEFGPRICRTLQGSISHAKWKGLEVVVKTAFLELILNNKNTNGKRILENIVDECKIMAKVESNGGHHNIVKLHHVNSDNERLILVLEKCHSGEVYRMVEDDGPFSEEVAKSFTRQIASGIKFLHEHHICHLDISLENIFVTRKGTCKIGDFGLAREFEEGQSSFQSSRWDRPGKLQYMSPELIRYKRFDGCKADVFALGVCLFIMLFGFPPFETASEEDERFRLISEQDDGLKNLLNIWGVSYDISDGVLDFIQSMLDYEHRRPSIHEIILHPWLNDH